MGNVLGVDGGSSKTHALLVSETGEVLGFGQAGGSNHQFHGLENSMHEISGAVHAALEQAALKPEDVELGCYCLSGADLPQDFTLLENAVNDLRFSRRVTIKNDTMAALRAGLTRPWGVVVVCGSGFNAAGRSPSGEELVLPGLGPISGDWGGGGDLSLEMIRQIARAWDGRGQATMLTELVLQAWQLESVEALIGKLYREEIDQQSFLNLVPMLFQAVEAGDDVARKLVVRLGTEVGVTALALIRRLEMMETYVEVVLAGGVYKGEGSLLIDTIRKVVHDEVPDAKIVRPHYEPVVGAALLALDAMDIHLRQTHIETLERSLPGDLKVGRRSSE